MDDLYEITERLALTEDGRAVPENDPDARWLFAIPGQSISLGEARRVGLVAGEGFTAEDDETTVSSTEEGEQVAAEAESVLVENGNDEVALAEAMSDGDDGAPADPESGGLSFPAETKRGRGRKARS